MNSAEAVAFVSRTLGHAQRAERLAGGVDDHLLRVHRHGVPASVLVRRLERSAFGEAREHAQGVQRLVREVRALRLFEEAGPLHALQVELNVPRVLVAELRTRTVVLDDVLRFRTVPVPFDFGALGRFLARLHSLGRLRNRGWLRRLFEQGPPDATCLVLGSLRATALVARENRRPSLVGWGDLRAGSPSEDVGVFAASLWQARDEAMHDLPACWAAFARAYSAELKGPHVWAPGDRRRADALAPGVPSAWFDELPTG